jgi:parvulin-like peptidyl-prolyl isomerase
MNFSDLAKTYSEGPASNEGGDLGFLDSGEMDTKIEAAAAKLKIDEISEPIETEIGTSIIQLIDKKEAGARPFEEVRDRAKQMLYRSLLDEKFQLWLENTKRLAHIEVRM